MRNVLSRFSVLYIGSKKNLIYLCSNLRHTQTSLFGDLDLKIDDVGLEDDSSHLVAVDRADYLNSRIFFLSIECNNQMPFLSTLHKPRAIFDATGDQASVSPYRRS
jgi:hypothetical protein